MFNFKYLTHRFCESNGKNYITFSTIDTPDKNVRHFLSEIEDATKHRTSIYSRTTSLPLQIQTYTNIPLEPAPAPWNYAYISPYTSKYSHVNFQKDTIIQLASASDSRNWKEYLDVITNTKIMSSILVMVGPLDDQQFETMISFFDGISKNSLFYWVYTKHKINTDTLVWNQVLTLNHYKTAVLNQLQLDSHGHFIERYDLKNLHLFSITTTFPPFTIMPEICRTCEKMKRCPQCTISGMVVDALNIIGRRMNFTWESHEDPSNKVGSTPISGHANASGAWEGTLGQVFYGDYQMSADAWNEKIGRSDMFDFVSFVNDRTILVSASNQDNLDFWLYTRPFTNKAWAVVGVFFLILLLVIIVPYYTLTDVENSVGYKVCRAICWMFFILISVHYEGALTMFFSTEGSISFENIREVMHAYDHGWNLMMMEGNEVYFVYYVQDGDPDYTRFWERKLNHPEKTVFGTVDSGIDQLLENDKTVLHFQEGSLKGYLLEKPKVSDKIQVFGGSKSEYLNIILNNNSPLRPMLKLGMRQIIEEGIMDHVQRHWLGKDIKSSDTTATIRQTKIAMRGRQVGIAFLFLSLLVCIVLSIFALEHIMQRKTFETIRNLVPFNLEYVN